MHLRAHTTTAVLITTALLALLLVSNAWADSDKRHSKRSQLVPTNSTYVEECAACHTAYPPSMLPAQSWTRIMNNLDNHFQRDASLDAETVATLSKWLNTHAGTGRRTRHAPPEDRITKSDWFVREHDEVPAAVWLDASIKSAANCAACHTTADKGNFSEHKVRMPAALSPSLRNLWREH